MQHAIHSHTPARELSRPGVLTRRHAALVPGSLGAFGIEKFRYLCAGLGVPKQSDAAARLFRGLCDWSDRPIGNAPLWATDITDDGTPFEYSVAFDGTTPKVRLLMEAEDASWDAGVRLTRRLGLRAGVDLTRFEQVSDLFAPPPGSTARFSLWHAATLDLNDGAAFKVYLNPQVGGLDQAADRVREALTRLGMPDVLRSIEPCLRSRGGRNRLLYFSLDLAATRDARVKLYFSHENATTDDIEADLEQVPGYTPGDARRWIEQILGFDGPFDARPVLTCLALKAGAEAPSVTVHVPARCYTANDAEVLDRVTPLLGADDRAKLRGALEGVAGRPLDVGRGLVTYVSLRRIPTGVNVTTYLAPEAYAIGAPRPSRIPPPSGEEAPRHSTIRALKPGATMANIESTIGGFQAALAEHPFLRRLDTGGSIADIRVMAPRFTFFVLCFQDMLRLVRQHVTDPDIKPLARVHELEDKGHEKWFLHDLERFGVALDLRWVFGRAHLPTRDLSYEIVSEVLRAADDHARLAIILSLEAAGHEFFGRVIGFLERIGEDGGLKYFARHHQEIEENHDVFGADSATRLSDLPISEEVLQRGRTAVARTFGAITKLADHLEESIIAASRERGPDEPTAVVALNNRRRGR